MAPNSSPEPDPRIAGYIAEISQPGIPYVSTSHLTLHDLYGMHGRGTVDQLIDHFFKRQRNEPTT